jgi:hypothetical protein
VGASPAEQRLAAPLGVTSRRAPFRVCLRLAFNRLASHRITTRVARLRQLRDRYRSEHRQYELRRLGRQAVFFEGRAKYSWTKVPEKKGVRGAAKELGNLIPEQYKVRGRENPPRGKLESPAGGGKEGNPAKVAIDGIPAAATSLVEALRTWYEQADDATWLWLRIQTLSFVAGGALLLVVPLSYYFFEHAA